MIIVHFCLKHRFPAEEHQAVITERSKEVKDNMKQLLSDIHNHLLEAVTEDQQNKQQTRKNDDRQNIPRLTVNLPRHFQALMLDLGTEVEGGEEETPTRDGGIDSVAFSQDASDKGWQKMGEEDTPGGRGVSYDIRKSEGKGDPWNERGSGALLVREPRQGERRGAFSAKVQRSNSPAWKPYNGPLFPDRVKKFHTNSGSAKQNDCLPHRDTLEHNQGVPDAASPRSLTSCRSGNLSRSAVKRDGQTSGGQPSTASRPFSTPGVAQSSDDVSSSASRPLPNPQAVLYQAMMLGLENMKQQNMLPADFFSKLPQPPPLAEEAGQVKGVGQAGIGGASGQWKGVGQMGNHGDSGQMKGVGQMGNHGDSRQMKGVGRMGNHGDSGQVKGVGQMGNHGDSGQVKGVGWMGNHGDSGQVKGVGWMGNHGDSGQVKGVGWMGNHGDSGQVKGVGQMGNHGDSGQVKGVRKMGNHGDSRQGKGTRQMGDHGYHLQMENHDPGQVRNHGYHGQMGNNPRQMQGMGPADCRQTKSRHDDSRQGRWPRQAQLDNHQLSRQAFQGNSSDARQVQNRGIVRSSGRPMQVKDPGQAGSRSFCKLDGPVQVNEKSSTSSSVSQNSRVTSSSTHSGSRSRDGSTSDGSVSDGSISDASPGHGFVSQTPYMESLFHEGSSSCSLGLGRGRGQQASQWAMPGFEKDPHRMNHTASLLKPGNHSGPAVPRQATSPHVLTPSTSGGAAVDMFHSRPDVSAGASRPVVGNQGFSDGLGRGNVSDDNQEMPESRGQSYGGRKSEWNEDERKSGGPVVDMFTGRPEVQVSNGHSRKMKNRRSQQSTDSASDSFRLDAGDLISHDNPTSDVIGKDDQTWSGDDSLLQIPANTDSHSLLADNSSSIPCSPFPNTREQSQSWSSPAASPLSASSSESSSKSLPVGRGRGKILSALVASQLSQSEQPDNGSGDTPVLGGRGRAKAFLALMKK